MRRLLSSTFAILIAFGLSGCNGVPLSTMWKLRGFKFVDADVSKMRAAARLPDWLAPTPEKIRMEAHRPGLEGEVEAPRLRLHLQRVRNPADAASLAKLSPGAEAAVVVELTPRDLPAMRALQEESKKLQAEGTNMKEKGGFEIKDNIACRKTDVPASGPILVDMWFHPDDEIGWVPIYERYDMRPEIEQARKERPESIDAMIPPCDKHVQRVEAVKAQ
jgi:hypothetical protein